MSQSFIIYIFLKLENCHCFQSDARDNLPPRPRADVDNDDGH